jgi:hypothetical protein
VYDAAFPIRERIVMSKYARDLDLERQWRRRLKAWQRSGLSGRDFCRRYSLSEPSFYGWRREIARRDREHAAAHEQPAFVPVAVVAAEPLEVVVRGGRVVRVGRGFDAAHLRAVVAALEGLPC